MSKASWYVQGFLLILAAAIFIIASTYHLSESPAVWYDEGYYTQAAMNLAEHGAQELQIAPSSFVPTLYVTVGYPLFLPVSLSYKLFGVGVLQGRGVMVVFMFAFIAAAYVCIRMLCGPWYAAWSALLVASFPILYGNGKNVIGEVPGMLFLLLCFIFLLLLERSSYRNAWAYIGAGLAAGLCVATKPIFILLLPALALTWFIRRREVKLHWGGFFMAVGAFIIPVLLWVHMQFGGGSSLVTILTYYVASPYQIDNRVSLAVQNFLQFFTQSTPLYTLLTIIFWSISMFLRKKRGIVVSTTELAMMVFCFFILGAYLRIEGWYRYFFPAEMAALLFLPYSLTMIFHYVSEKILFLQKVLWLPYAIIVLLIAGQLYQLEHGSYVAQYYQSTNTRDLTAALSSLGSSTTFFLYNVPEIAVFLPSQNYYQYIKAPDPSMSVGADQIPVLQSGLVQYVVVAPNVYASNPALFTHYSKQSQIGNYLLLKRDR
jgi:4-amino-4-deoxy-L-arabinose transferase-like glycosyltransferase